MDLYEVERLLSKQGVDMAHVEIRPALIVNNEIAMIGKQGRSPISFARDIKTVLDEEKCRTSKEPIRKKYCK